MNNIFLNSDPLLAPTPATDYAQRLDQLRQLQADIDLRRQQLLATPTPGATPAPPASAAPPPATWQEIDRLTADLTEREFAYVTASPDYQESEQRIARLLQEEQLRHIRPLVEQSEAGREALTAHLVLVRRLKKDAARQADRDMMLFREYTEKHSDIPYKDFIKQKGKKK